jgi:hypothetical protein
MDARSIREANRNRQMAAQIDNRYGAKGLAEKFKTPALQGFAPGNIGDINRVVWPFFFTFTNQDVNPGQSVIRSFTVTQEACFIWRMSSKAVFKLVAGSYVYINPRKEELAPGLKFALRDAQSTRELQGRFAQPMDTMGFGNFPDLLPSSQLMLPNATMQVTFTNEHPTEVYRPFVTFIGYRLRIEDSQNILSTVTG